MPPRNDLVGPGGQPAKPTRTVTDRGAVAIHLTSPHQEAAIETKGERILLEGDFILMPIRVWQKTLAISLGRTAEAIHSDDSVN